MKETFTIVQEIRKTYSEISNIPKEYHDFIVEQIMNTRVNFFDEISIFYDLNMKINDYEDNYFIDEDLNYFNTEE